MCGPHDIDGKLWIMLRIGQCMDMVLDNSEWLVRKLCPVQFFSFFLVKGSVDIIWIT